jgi:hypothetical protein
LEEGPGHPEYRHQRFVIGVARESWETRKVGYTQD